MAARKTRRLAQERRALCPGSFDPATRGHIDVIARAARLFDRLYVGVLENPSKVALFDAEERVVLLRGIFRHSRNVEVVAFSGLTADLAVRLGARWLVRGIRSALDFGFELSMAHSNRLCIPGEIETVFLAASPQVSFISSTLVREVAEGGGDLSAFVTPAVEKALRRKLARHRDASSKDVF